MKEKDMPKISIIIPIYNMEKYLDRALESIVNQENIDFKQIEIVLINDGSTDNSEKIIKRYLNKYPILFKYYLKENSGVADTRNYGINKSKGEYIVFVDGDDYIDKNLIFNLANKLNENIYDIIKYKGFNVDTNGKIINNIDSPIFEENTGEEAFEKLYKSENLIDVLWLYAFKRKFIIDNNLFFIKGLNHEDFGLIPLMILKANKVCAIDVYGYYYVQNDNESITRNSNNIKISKRAIDLLLYYDNMIEKIESYTISKRSKENVKLYYTNAIILNINNFDNEKDRKNYIKEIKKRKMIKNIKIRNLKQFLKRVILKINIKLYLKLR